MPASDWFVTLDGAEEGPMPTAELKALVAQGRIRPTTRVRRSDMATALPAARVKGLLAGMPAPTARRVEAEPDAPPPPQPSTPGASPAAADNPYAAPVTAPAQQRPDDTLGGPAGFGIRTGAYLLDVVVLIVLVVGILVAFGENALGEDGTLAEKLIGLLLFTVYFGVTEVAFGASLGKLACGLRVVNGDGSPIGVLGTLKRSGSRFVLNIIPLIGLVDVLMVLRDSRQAWHDGMSRTYVVHRHARPGAAKQRPDGRRVVTRRVVRRPVAGGPGATGDAGGLRDR